MAKHVHRAIKGKCETRGFSCCVRPERCNPAAHGGVCYIDHCRCGATRRTNSTGPGRKEVGEWR